MSDYWERRAARDMWQYMEDAEKTAEEIKKLYQRGYRYLAEEINQIFERFRDAHNLTDEEARQLLNTMQSPTDIHELREKLKQTADGEEKAELLAKLESAAYQHRIQRFQSLVNQIDTIMHQTYKAELKIAEDACQRLAEDVYYKTIYQVQKQTGLGFSFSLIDDAAIKKAMSLKWYGKNYSERIWVNTDRLAEKIKEELMVNFITGRTNREAAESVQFEFAKGMQNARRLVRTESCYLANQMEMQSYEECEIEKYRFVATLDLKTSDICRELDGKVFLVSEQKPGKNCPPKHPYCRSTTVCDIGEEELARMARRARNPETGRTETVPANMTYKQWYDQKVKGHPEAELNEKKIKHQSADKKQYQRYKDVLKDDAPKTLDDFQNMKYGKPEKWDFVKLDYQRRNELLQHPERKLPNAENAILPEPKFTKYLFDKNSKSGYPKGKAFTSRLGYDESNWKKLQQEIRYRSTKYPAQHVDNNGYGDRYVQKMILYGQKDTPANVVVAWIKKPDGTVGMTSAYIKEAK